MSSCKTCKFAVLDVIGLGDGLCICTKYEDYKEIKPSINALQSARVKLGNSWDSDIFWPGEGRECMKYEAR